MGLGAAGPTGLLLVLEFYQRSPRFPFVAVGQLHGRSVFGCQKVFLPLVKSITTTRTCLTQAGAGCWEYFFNVKNIQKSFPKAWGSMGEARGKRGGSVGEAGGSGGIFRGSALFEPRKTSVLGGSNRPQYPF